MEGAFRGFIAVPTPSPLLQRLQTLEEELKELRLDCKWVLPQRIHLTLKFLGETPFSLLKDLKVSLDQIAYGHPGFSFYIDRFGAFPNPRRPRILWVGSDESPLELQRLIGSLESACVGLGFQKEERVFKPHLTVGRLRSLKNCDRLERWVKENPLSWREEFPCKQLVLFQSVLRPEGPIYTPLHEVTLKKI